MNTNSLSSVGRVYNNTGYEYARTYGTPVRGCNDLQASPSEAHLYAWATIKNGRFFTYGGRTSRNLHSRLMNPNDQLGYSTMKYLNKVTNDGYHSGSFSRLGWRDIVVFKASAKTDTGENEQQVINALWHAQRYIAKKYGRKNLMLNLNTQAEHRTLDIGQRTFGDCVNLFEEWIEAKSPALALRAKTNAAKQKAKAFIRKSQAIMA